MTRGKPAMPFVCRYNARMQPAFMYHVDPSGVYQVQPTTGIVIKALYGTRRGAILPAIKRAVVSYLDHT